VTVETVGVVTFYVKGDDYEYGDAGERERAERTRDVVERVVARLDDRGVDHVYDDRTAAALGHDGVALDAMEDAVDAVVAVGGDGTILRCVQRMHDPVPVLGVNTGRLGFLATASPEDVEHRVDGLVNEGETERRTRLAVTVDGDPVLPALNETVAVTSRPAKIMEVAVRHDGETVEEVRADGLVVATPTGSTAYAMSAGGPLLEPSVGGRLVVPLAPFRRSTSPWVLDADGRTTIELTRVDRSASVVQDGSHVDEVGHGTEIVFERHDNDAVFLASDESFFERVRRKLG
jgi:NAD+ kinase